MNDRNLRNCGKANGIISTVQLIEVEVKQYLSRRIIKEINALVKSKNAGVSRHFFISFRDLLF